MSFRRFSGSLAALLGALASGVACAAAPALRASCDAPGFAQVLDASGGPVQARAVWLDARSITWPRAAADGVFRLFHSARGGLLAEPGQPVRGADASLELQSHPVQRMPGHAYLPPGPLLTLARAVEASWLQGQSLVARLDGEGRVLEAAGLQQAGALDDLFAEAEKVPDLGARPARSGTSFQLWAPTADAVSLCLYRHGDGPSDQVLPLRRDAATGVWSARVPKDLSGRYYTYLVDVFVPGAGRVRNRVTDPYSVSLSTDSLRSFVADLSRPGLKPAGWDAHRSPSTVARPTDMTIYELHVRDFSASDQTVPPAHRGKYLAFTDTGSDGMRHLRALAEAGLTDVHLLPVFDFATVPEKGCVTPSPRGGPDSESQQQAVMAAKDRDCFNWGYDPWHYTSPEGSYASDAADGARRIVEFRRMVQSLHEAGLRVGMDVVYNHTVASGQQHRSVLDRIVPGYYHRLDEAGQVEHSTCCDNTATEHRMMGRLLLDSVATWAREYRIDSFRFDLMAHQPRELMERLQRRLAQDTGREIPLVGEGWNFGEVADGARFVQASQLSLNGTGIGTFNDRLRDAVRGGGPSGSPEQIVAEQGFVNGLFYDPNGASRQTRAELLAAADLVRIGLAGSLRRYPILTARGPVLPAEMVDYHGQPAGYASRPSEVVNYVENHDNLTLFDANVFKLPRATPSEDRARVQMLAAALVAFSQGVAYFHAGIDLLRSKSLDGNSFDSGDWFNRLDWSGRDNNFGVGLPPREGNEAAWPAMRPLLADASIKPRPADIAWTAAAFRDLLKIRASTSLFHLATADEVVARLDFPNAGPGQEPTVVVGHLDGRGRPGARFDELVYLVNVDRQAHAVTVDALKRKGFVLHPVQASPAAADRRPAESARYDDATGRFEVPARCAAVFVRAAGGQP